MLGQLVEIVLGLIIEGVLGEFLLEGKKSRLVLSRGKDESEHLIKFLVGGGD